MNCPSRTDDITLSHPTWNQSPPFLAADLTTCADLNGIANAREHRNGGSGDGSLADSRDEKDYLTHPPPMPDRPGPQPSGRWNDSFHPRSKQDVLGGEGQPRPYPVILSQDTRKSGAWGWISWTASVLVCSTLFSSLRAPGFLSTSLTSVFFASSDPQCDAAAQPSGASIVVDEEDGYDYSPTTPLFSRPSKRSMCGTGAADPDEYDLPLHVGALFIMLAVSFLACAFPLIVKKLPRVRVPASFFFGVRHFGTGVLLATAFVHLLPTAFILLGDPCLSNFWTTDYPAIPGAIALAAVFFVTIIEMIFQPARHHITAANQIGASHATPADPEMAEARRVAASGPAVDDVDADDSDRQSVSDGAAARARSSSFASMQMGPIHGTTNSIGRTLSRMSRNADIVPSRDIDCLDDNGNSKNIASKTNDAASSTAGVDLDNTDPSTAAAARAPFTGGHPYILTPAQQHQKDVLQCMMLEVGILFHSIFIGMTLAVTTGSGFIILLIAIAFHQTFEGLALGSRIAEIRWHQGAAQPWLMALAYGCTTPIGQAIGIATHSLYDPNSEFGLVLVGTMNAISSGLLVFASLVELLSEDFLSDESWRCLRGKKRVIAFALVFAGAFGMSVVGAWA